MSATKLVILIAAMAYGFAQFGSTKPVPRHVSTDEGRAVYLYCRTKNLRNEATAWVCDFGDNERKGCLGWQHSRIDKKDVKGVDRNYKKCESGDTGAWLTRIEVR